MPALFSCRCAPAERASRRRVFWLSVLLLVGLLPACGPDDPATVDLFFTSDRNGPPDLFHSHNSTISDEPDPVIAPIHRTEPTWSPDGSRIAFVSDSADTSVLYTIGADGTGLKRVPNTPADVTAPEWSPDGSQIAFAASRGLERALYTIRPDGTNRTTLATESKGNPSWSRDGTRIAFVSDRDNNTEIYTIGRDGENLRRLTENSAQDVDPAWAPPRLPHRICLRPE